MNWLKSSCSGVAGRSDVAPNVLVFVVACCASHEQTSLRPTDGVTACPPVRAGGWLRLCRLVAFQPTPKALTLLEHYRIFPALPNVVGKRTAAA